MPFITQGKTNWKFLLIVVVLAVIVGGGISWFTKKQITPITQLLQIGSQKDIKYCEKDEDCACGVHKTTRNCFYGNKDYVDTTQQCPDFCTGIAANFEIKCINKECKQINTIEDETANWQTYRNEEYRFEVKYPDSFFNFQKEGETENQYLIVMFGVPEIPNEVLISMILYKNEENLTLLNWIEKRKEEIKQEEFNVGDFQEEEISIDNQKGIKFTYTGELGLIENYYFSSGEVIYEFSKNHSTIKGGKLDKDFNQMLSTFRFIEKEAQDEELQSAIFECWCDICVCDSISEEWGKIIDISYDTKEVDLNNDGTNEVIARGLYCIYERESIYMGGAAGNQLFCILGEENNKWTIIGGMAAEYYSIESTKTKNYHDIKSDLDMGSAGECRGITYYKWDGFQYKAVKTEKKELSENACY